MKITYLDDCDGRKGLLLASTVIEEKTECLVSRLKESMTLLWGGNTDDVYIDQNVSTHIAYIVDLVSRNREVSVYLDQHEVFWMKDILENGELSLNDMSYPNYAEKHQFNFQPVKVTLFDPEKTLDINEPEDVVPIIIHSHVSRLTGQLFDVEKLYKNVKSKYPDAVCVTDGSQIIGGQKVQTTDFTDAYLTLSSKFIGGELHLGVCKLSSEFKKEYLAENDYPTTDLSGYKRELFSAVSKMDKFIATDFESHISKIGQYLKKKLEEFGLSKYIYCVPDQVRHIVTLSVGDKEKTKEFVQVLESKYGVKVSHNMGFSLVEPKTPLVRVAISSRAEKGDIDIFIEASKGILE